MKRKVALLVTIKAPVRNQSKLTRTDKQRSAWEHLQLKQELLQETMQPRLRRIVASGLMRYGADMQKKLS